MEPYLQDVYCNLVIILLRINFVKTTKKITLCKYLQVLYFYKFTNIENQIRIHTERL